MTYDQLAAFLRVASEGSFTAASASLHKSQPAISKLVRNLERELGLELFDRNAYRASLSDAGRCLFERAVLLLESTEALRAFAQELSGETERVVRVAVDAVAPLGGLLPAFRAVHERHPSVRVELRTERLTGAIEALRSDATDLAIAANLGLDKSTMEIRHFASVPIVPVARADHPLARARRPDPKLLRSYPQVILRDSALGEISTSLNVLIGGLRWTVTDVHAKKELIAAGLGWGGLPEHLVAAEVESGSLAALEVPEFEASAMELFAARRRDRPHGSVAQALWQGLASKSTAEPVPAHPATQRARSRRSARASGRARPGTGSRR